MLSVREALALCTVACTRTNMTLSSRRYSRHFFYLFIFCFDQCSLVYFLFFVFVFQLKSLDEFSVNDFNREADILEEIDSPYIVKFYGAMITDEYYCSVTEFAPCGSLEDILKGKVSPVMRIKFLRDISHGMTYLHQNSIIHRDLKPGNVLCFDCTNVSTVACCKITDFGGSKFFKEDEAANEMTKGVGTSVYMVKLKKKKIVMTIQAKNNITTFIIITVTGNAQRFNKLQPEYRCVQLCSYDERGHIR